MTFKTTKISIFCFILDQGERHRRQSEEQPDRSQSRQTRSDFPESQQSGATGNVCNQD